MALCKAAAWAFGRLHRSYARPKAGCRGTPVTKEKALLSTSKARRLNIYSSFVPVFSYGCVRPSSEPPRAMESLLGILYRNLINIHRKKAILYYTILYYTILYYTILYYTILYYTILYYTILYYTILYYTILYYTILYSTILYYTIILGSNRKFSLASLSPPGRSCHGSSWARLLRVLVRALLQQWCRC